MASRISTLFAAAGIAVLLPVGAPASATASAGVTGAPAAAFAVAAPAGHPGDPIAAEAKAGTATFGIQPVPHDNSDTRAAFSVGATPGGRTKDAVRVSNFGDQPLTLHIYASDAINTPEGGYDLKPSGTPPTDVGTWVAFDKAQPYLTIPAKTAADLPFTLSVPASATRGDHPGGIVASLTTPSQDSHGNRVNVEQRVGTRIYVRVAGDLKPRIAVQQVDATYHPNWNPLGSGSATVSYKVTNTGNVRLTAKQSVHVTSPLGGSVQAPALKDLEQLLPGNSIQVTTTISGVDPSFVTTAHISVDPAPVPGDLDPQVVPTSATAAMATPPWTWLIVLVLVVGLGFEVFRQRRRARRPAKPSSGPAAGKAAKAAKLGKLGKPTKNGAPKPAAEPATAAAGAPGPGI